jgi:hypothetical protein
VPHPCEAPREPHHLLDVKMGLFFFFFFFSSSSASALLLL